jgi:hypothetical protein
MEQVRLGLEQLGDEIALLAAHIQAATCRWLEMVAEFDERGGWADWGCKSCAEWISYRCSMAPGAAREHVRVARRLRELPLIHAAFACAELSYSKVRALTRLDDVAKEAELLELARYATAAQLERTVRGYRRVLRTDAARAYDERFLTVMHDDDGAVLVKGRLPREDGAILMKALEAMRDAQPQVSAETPPSENVSAGTRNADALVAVADAALAAADAERTGGDRFQVVVHADIGALTADEAGTARTELDDGAPLAPETVRRLCCDCSTVGLLERDGKPLSVGRKTRSIPPSIRRALRARDGGCRFPGCTRRRHVERHHIKHWVHGGKTALPNLVELCRHHHRLVHEGGFRIDRARGDDLIFRRPDGRRLDPAPRPPRGDHHVPADLSRRHGLSLTPDSCRPGWLGERLDLHSAVDALLNFAPPPEAAEG